MNVGQKSSHPGELAHLTGRAHLHINRLLMGLFVESLCELFLMLLLFPKRLSLFFFLLC